MLTGFVGLATMLATAAFPVYVVALPIAIRALLAFGFVMVLFVCYTHRSNIERMRAGTENRAQRLWLLRHDELETMARDRHASSAAAPDAARHAGDGEFHSGEQLAKRLRISRGGVWKLIRRCSAIGIDVASVPRQGYRLAARRRSARPKTRMLARDRADRSRAAGSRSTCC